MPGRFSIVLLLRPVPDEPDDFAAGASDDTATVTSPGALSASTTTNSLPTAIISPTLPRVEKFVKEYDIRLAIHNHGPEDKIWASPLDILKAIKGLDPRIGCCIDVGHTVRAGTDVIEAIHAVGPRLFNMHIKDLTSFTDKESQVAVGDGKMPVRKIFEALKKTDGEAADFSLPLISSNTSAATVTAEPEQPEQPAMPEAAAAGVVAAT